MAEPRDELDRQSPIPLYFQVGRILREDIRSGKYAPGDCLPTESELCARFSVSRATIRQAVSDLVYQGLLNKQRSKGTLVAPSQWVATLSDLASFTSEMMSGGANLSTRILKLDYIPAPGTVADLLELEPTDSVAHLERLRFVDKKPVAYENWYAAAKYLPHLEASQFGETGIEQSTYYVLMKQYGIEIARAVDTVSAIDAEGHDARHLRVKEGTPVLMRTRLSFMSNSVPLIYATGVYLIRLRFVLDAKRVAPSVPNL